MDITSWAIPEDPFPDKELFSQMLASLLRKDMNPAMWQHINILKIERVENGMQEDGSAEPYYKASIVFRHLSWKFCDSRAASSLDGP